MSSINNIATLSNISFKLYGDKLYRLYNYNKEDNISQLLKKYRLNNNLTLRELSEKLKSSTSHLCIIEKGIKKNYSVSKDLETKINNLIKYK